MSVESALRLALVLAAVWLASLAARRWGHSVSGYLGGLPLIGGPITLFLAIDYGTAFAAIFLCAGFTLIRPPRDAARLPEIPPIELRLRLAAALALASVILWGAQAFGPVVSGVLLSVPVTGSIMPPFTLALYGPEATKRLARGFTVGLTGFSAFFFVVASNAISLGIGMTFLLAVAAALVTVFIVTAALRFARPG